MGKLNQIDKAAAGKGKGIETLWQFVKFIVDWGLFQSTAETGLGIFLAANISNVIAQIVSFFINREKTFNSSANIAVTLPIYIVFTIALICFSAWLSPTLISFFTEYVGENAAISISGAVCGAIQFFLYFPVDKILFHKKKEDKDAEKEEKEPAKKA